MIMFIGSEIEDSSGRLRYSLFESNWPEQKQSTKKDIIIMAEILKKPHRLLIGQVYPLNLETFIRVGMTFWLR